MPAERTPHADDSLLAQPLLAVTEWSLRSPTAVVVGAVLLALLAVVLAASGLTLKTSRLDLLNPRSEYNRRWLAYLHEFGDRDDAVLVVRAENPDDLTAAIDDLAARLRRQPELFESVFHRRDLTALKRKALHYLPPQELAALEGQLQSAARAAASPSAPAAEALARIAALNHQLAHVGAPSAEQRLRVETEYARAAESLLAALNDLPARRADSHVAERFEPGDRDLPQGSRPPDGPGDIKRLSYAQYAVASPARLAEFDPQYLLADDGRLGFVLFRLVPQHGEATPNSRAIARVRKLLTEAQASHPSVWTGLTGMPVIEHDEMQASQTDMIWTSLLSLVGVAVLFAAGYGGLRHAVLACAVLLLGMAWSFGFVTLAIGHLNILSAAFGVVLIGLGIDFGIHYVASYLRLRGEGCDERTALLCTATEVGPAVVTGGVTTSAAFFMAAMTDFVGVRELGLVAGGGLLLCVAAAVVVLPPLVLLVDRRWPLTRVPAILPAGHWFRFPTRWPRATMAAALLGALTISLGITQLRYDHNLLNLQPRHLESADIERQLLAHLDDSVWFAVSICNSRQELRERKARFEQLPIVAKTEEIASLLPDHSSEHAERIQSVCRLLSAAGEVPSASASLAADPLRLMQEISQGQQLLARETPYETTATLRLAALNSALAHLAPAEIQRRLDDAAAWSNPSPQAAALRDMADPLPPRLEDLPRELVDRFVGENRCYLLKVYARGNIWNMHELESFVRQVESIDPRVTGHPVQTYYASRHMQQSYVWAGLYALVAVFVLLCIDFRSLGHSLLAMVPLAVGAIMMCGLLGWLGLAFNPANMIVLPLILGIGVDDGVHLVHVWRQQRGRFRLGDATALALLLTSTTTMASFGSLILARHQGLQSLGQVLTLGVLTCLCTSLVFFPALIASLGRSGKSLAAESRLVEEPPTAPTPAKPPTAQAAVTLSPPAVFAPAHAPEPPTPLFDWPLAELPAEEPPLEFIAHLPPPIALLAEPAVEPPLPSPTPEPVTDEEVAALLESAYAHSTLRFDSPADEEPAACFPRRRELLHRTIPRARANPES